MKSFGNIHVYRYILKLELPLQINSQYVHLVPARIWLYSSWRRPYKQIWPSSTRYTLAADLPVGACAVDSARGKSYDSTTRRPQQVPWWELGSSIHDVKPTYFVGYHIETWTAITAQQPICTSSTSQNLIIFLPKEASINRSDQAVPDIL